MPDSNAISEFGPLAVENVGVTLAVELLEQPLTSTPPPNAFVGAGVYALYYSGDHPAYEGLTRIDKGRHKYPVYIGQAAGESSKQGFNFSSSTTKKKLYERIAQHAKSIDEVNNLELGDFRCRFLVLNDAYIALAEAVLIRAFRPAWNGMSFGSKVVGKNGMGEILACGMHSTPGAEAVLRVHRGLMKQRHSLLSVLPNSGKRFLIQQFSVSVGLPPHFRASGGSAIERLF